MLEFRGLLRFLFFVSIIALAGTGYYAHTLRNSVASLRAANVALMAERDSLRTSNEMLTKQSADLQTRVTAAETRAAEFQKKVEETEAARSRGRRR